MVGLPILHNVIFKLDPLTNAGLRYCPILYKGYEDAGAGTYERAPAIYLDRETRSLSVYISTTASSQYPEVLI